MRLLFITPRFFPFMGGVENHVYQVARRLAKVGWDVTVLSADPGGRLATEESKEGVRIIRARSWPSQNDFYFAPDIYHHIREGAWDIVHMQSYHTFVAPLAMLAALRSRIPYIVTFHGGGHSSPIRNRLRGLQRKALRPLFAGAEKLIATARFEIDTYGKELHLPKERFVFIPNGSDLVNAEMLASVQREPGLIASIGRLEKYKGHHRILAAMPLILKERPDARLWIAGAGPYEEPLRRMAAKLGIAGQVEIRAIPVSEREQMAREMARVDVVTLLSEFETHPMALLEALAAGCKALVADTSGLSEVAALGYAQAVPLDCSPAQVAQAVTQLLDQPRSSEVSVVLPTWDECADRLSQLYRQTLQTSHSYPLRDTVRDI